MQINKNELSIFKYTNDLTDSEMQQIVNDYVSLERCRTKIGKIIYESVDLVKEKKDYEVVKLITGDEIDNIVDRCINTYPTLVFTDGPGQNRMKSMIKDSMENCNRDKKFQAYNRILILDQCLNMLRTILFSRSIRGEDNEWERNQLLPKLLLISEKAFLNAKNEKTLAQSTLNLSEMQRLMSKGIIYNVFVKGKCREAKQAFQIMINKNSKLGIMIWDRCFGSFTFYIEQQSSNAFVLSPAVNCMKRHSGVWCDNSLDCQSGKSCCASFDQCVEGRLQTAVAVVMCVQEYLIRKEETRIARTLAKQNLQAKQSLQDNQEPLAQSIKTKAKNPLAETKAFRVDGSITVHSYSTSRTSHSGKFTGDGKTGVQKCPHVRTGYYRTYKNGKKVYVKSCIIHKENYKGYNSADEI